MINLCEDQFFNNDIGMAYETGIQVLKEELRSPVSKSYLWMRRGDPPDKPVVLVDYSPSRVGEIPLRLLDGLKGYLVSDAYAGYNPAIEKQGLKWVACNDHARR
jgi:transposase